MVGASAAALVLRNGRRGGNCGPLAGMGTGGPGRPTVLVAAFPWPRCPNFPAATHLLPVALLTAEEQSEGLCHVRPFLGFPLGDLRACNSVAFVGGQSATVTPAATFLHRPRSEETRFICQTCSSSSGSTAPLVGPKSPRAASPGIFLVPDSRCLVTRRQDGRDAAAKHGSGKGTPPHPPRGHLQMPRAGAAVYCRLPRTRTELCLLHWGKSSLWNRPDSSVQKEKEMMLAAGAFNSTYH